MTATLDGKRIAFGKDTVFEVQIGKWQGKYKTRWSFKGELGRALFWYDCINIGNGFKKRLLCRTMSKPVLARQFS